MTAPVAERGRTARMLLGAYAIGLALIALWPVPVDSGAEGVLAAVSRAVPWLTYDRIEFTANIVLFVPLGWLLWVAAPKARLFVMPVALAVTLLIESAQALMLERRTPSVSDVIANTIGAAIGLCCAWALERRRTDRAERREA